MVAVSPGDPDLDFGQGLPDRARPQGLVGSRDAQHRRRFRKAVAFEQTDADIVEELRHSLGQRGAAAHGELQPAAQRRMRGPKQ